MLMHPQIDPIAIKLGPLAIHWYGLTYLAAFTMFYLLAAQRVKRPWYAQAGWTREAIEDLLFGMDDARATTVVVVTHDERIGARAGRRIRMNDGRLEPPC